MEETLCHLEYFATEGKWNLQMLFLTIEVHFQGFMADAWGKPSCSESIRHLCAVRGLLHRSILLYQQPLPCPPHSVPTAVAGCLAKSVLSYLYVALLTLNRKCRGKRLAASQYVRSICGYHSLSQKAHVISLSLLYLYGAGLSVT